MVQDARRYFANSKVTCILCPRDGGTADSLGQKLRTGNLFTHHQKTVVLDVAVSPG